MPFEINWYIDQQVLLTRYWGEQTEEDLIVSLSKITEMAESSPYRQVHRITDLSGVEVPVSLMASQRIFRQMDRPFIPGLSIIVGERNSMVRTVTSSVRFISNQQTRSMETLEEALEFLVEVDPDIQWQDNLVLQYR